MSKLLKQIDKILLPLLILGMASLSYSIFSSSYSSERTVQPQEVTVQPQSPREPYISIVNGIANDFNTVNGPWWLLDPMAKLQVFNPTNQTVRAVLSLRFDKAFCSTSREISVTAQNKSETIVLNSLNPSAVSKFRLEMKARSSSSVVIQTSGPVCQVENDPRLFLGEVKVVDLFILRSSDFNFGLQD